MIQRIGLGMLLAVQSLLFANNAPTPITAVDHSSAEHRHPASCSRDPEIRTGSRGQAVGSRSINCQQPLVENGFIFNSPYPHDELQQNIYYSSFIEQPKTLDPARSYEIAEQQIAAQIYEPVLQYQYLQRPYALEPLLGSQMPQVLYYDKMGEVIADPQLMPAAYSVYIIKIKPGVFYQPHPALAQTNDKTRYYYYPINADFLQRKHIKTLSDFKFVGTREVTSDDFIYEIKRLANPGVSSPIYGLMSDYIAGFREYAEQLPSHGHVNGFLDLRDYPLSGLRKIDDYTFEITIIGEYPQFMFWLSMPFFSPIPWEADRFYSQPGMAEKNLSLDWYPIGTGAFMLTENNPNSRMILEKNPNFHPEFFPTNGSPEDKAAGYLLNARKRLPLIDKAIYTLEKESIPRWSKFLQGYYDSSGISADSFDQAIHITHSGVATLSPDFQRKGMRLEKSPELAIYYLGFNMLDPIVGGRSERARKLRRAISIAIDYEENIAIFLNGRGQAAQGPIPPGIFGHRSGALGINPYVYVWNGHAPKRRCIAEAKKLMREAGYSRGIDPKTGKPLILYYDLASISGPDDKAQLDWMRKQFARIGIELDIRATQYNRFQEKMRSGNAQLFKWGWRADYPDPENFLFLFYGPSGKVAYGGENAANYQNPAFDKLFDLMKNRRNDAIRQQLIDRMVDLLRRDAPWAWGVNTETFTLSQQWLTPMKTNTISLGTLKYTGIDVKKRLEKQQIWNKPVLWPIGLFLGLVVISLLPFVIAYRKKQRLHAPRMPKC
jgi:oligopeptide transport system substrate-binding protein